MTKKREDNVRGKNLTRTSEGEVFNPVNVFSKYLMVSPIERLVRVVLTVLSDRLLCP